MKSIKFAVIGTLASNAYAASTTASSYCLNNNNVCFRWAKETSSTSTTSGNVYFQITAPDSYQWVAVGIGSGMSGSDMFVIYQNGQGNVTLSTRKGSGHDMPQYESRSQVHLLSGSGVNNSTMVANIKCGDCTSLDLSGSNSWIAAWKQGSSLDSTSVSESIQEHDDYASFTVDLAQLTDSSASNPFTSSASSNSSSGVVTGSSGGTNNALVNAHGIIMAVTFALAYPIGAVLMPFLGKWLLHAGWQILAFLAMWVGFGLGYIVSKSDGSWGNGSHVILGVLVCALMTLQPVLGWVHHQYFLKHRQRGVVSHVHIWYGRILMLIGIINGGLGLRLAQSPTGYIIAYAVACGIAGVIYTIIATRNEVKRNRSSKLGNPSLMTSQEEYSM